MLDHLYGPTWRGDLDLTMQREPPLRHSPCRHLLWDAGVMNSQAMAEHFTLYTHVSDEARQA